MSSVNVVANMQSPPAFRSSGVRHVVQLVFIIWSTHQELISGSAIGKCFWRLEVGSSVVCIVTLVCGSVIGGLGRPRFVAQKASLGGCG